MPLLGRDGCADLRRGGGGAPVLRTMLLLLPCWRASRRPDLEAEGGGGDPSWKRAAQIERRREEFLRWRLFRSLVGTDVGASSSSMEHGCAASSGSSIADGGAGSPAPCAPPSAPLARRHSLSSRWPELAPPLFPSFQQATKQRGAGRATAAPQRPKLHRAPGQRRPTRRGAATAPWGRRRPGSRAGRSTSSSASRARSGSRSCSSATPVPSFAAPPDWRRRARSCARRGADCRSLVALLFVLRQLATLSVGQRRRSRGKDASSSGTTPSSAGPSPCVCGGAVGGRRRRSASRSGAHQAVARGRSSKEQGHGGRRWSRGTTAVGRR
ncbi:unnamed protein product [Urochloa humidicola]